MPLAREELGAVQAAGFDADQDLARGRGGDGDGFEFEDFGAAGVVDDGCAHCFGHGWGVGCEGAVGGSEGFVSGGPGVGDGSLVCGDGQLGLSVGDWALFELGDCSIYHALVPLCCCAGRRGG